MLLQARANISISIGTQQSRTRIAQLILTITVLFRPTHANNLKFNQIESASQKSTILFSLNYINKHYDIFFKHVYSNQEYRIIFQIYMNQQITFLIPIQKYSQFIGFLCCMRGNNSNMVRAFALVKSIQNIKVDFLNSSKKKKILRNRIINVFSIKINPFLKNQAKYEIVEQNEMQVKYQSKIEQFESGIGNDSYPCDKDYQQFDFPQIDLKKFEKKRSQAKAKIFRQFTNKKLTVNQQYQQIRVPGNHMTMIENQLKRAATVTPKKEVVSNSTNLTLILKPKIQLQQRQKLESDQQLSVTSSRARMYKQSQPEQKQSRQLQIKIIQHVLKHGIDNAEIQQKFGMKGYREAFKLLKKIHRRGVTFLMNMAVSMKLRPPSYPKNRNDKVDGHCLSKIGSKQLNNDQKIVKLRSIILRLVLTLGKRSKQTVKKQQISEGVQLLDELQQFIKKSYKIK